MAIDVIFETVTWNVRKDKKKYYELVGQGLEKHFKKDVFCLHI
jgi:hypothetical protein